MTESTRYDLVPAYRSRYQSYIGELTEPPVHPTHFAYVVRLL